MPGDNENMQGTENNEELVVKDTSSEETNQETQQEQVPEKTFTQEEVNTILSKERARTERKYQKREESKLAQAKELENIMRQGLGLNEEDDVISKVKNFYEEQGIELSKPSHNLNTREADILGKADAQDFINYYDDKEIKARANELANKRKQGKTTEREEAEFYELGLYLTQKIDEKQLKDKGVNTDILKDKSFMDFARKFNTDVSISDIYDMYNKMGSIQENKPKKPDSAGSTQSIGADNSNKEYYTPEEVDKISKKELDNPKVLKNIMKSMTLWK